MKGVIDLRTPTDLLRKLESDFERVQANPLDSFAAYDFFVTAWHLISSGSALRQRMRLPARSC